MALYDIPVHRLMHDWAEQNAQMGKTFRKQEIIQWFLENYPQVKESTIAAHLAAMSTNVASRIHHKTVRPGNNKDLFFKVSADEFRLYDAENDPAPIYRSDKDDEDEYRAKHEEDSDEAIAAQVEFALEQHLQHYLIRNLHTIEPGLAPYFENFSQSMEVDAGGRRIDILAKDAKERAVVIELKVSKGYDRVIGQLLRYVNWVKRNLTPTEDVRGIIVASEISEDLILAAENLPHISLFSYQLGFSISKV